MKPFSFTGSGNKMAATLLDETGMIRSNSRRSALLYRCSPVSIAGTNNTLRFTEWSSLARRG
jgi:hypothetical protein